MLPELICMEFLSFAFAFSQCLEGNMSVLQYQPKEQLWLETTEPSVYIRPVETSSPCFQLWGQKDISLVQFFFRTGTWMLKQMEWKLSRLTDQKYKSSQQYMELSPLEKVPDRNKKMQFLLHGAYSKQPARVYITQCLSMKCAYTLENQGLWGHVYWGLEFESLIRNYKMKNHFTWDIVRYPGSTANLNLKTSSGYVICIKTKMQ